MSLDWLHHPLPAPSAAAATAAAARQAQLTKPAGALGRLEALALRLAALQGVACPRLERVRIVVFAGDHGVVAEGVSAYPQVVTAEMLRNFARGGAAIAVLARLWGATLEVVNVGTVAPLEALPGVLDRRVGAGTGNLVREPAMSATQLDAALAAGFEAAERAADAAAQLFIGGDMGIGNTTAATALGCALLGCGAAALAGPGTGLDAEGVRRKARLVDAALARAGVSDPLDALRELGGFELAALAGACLRSAQRGIPVLVDGFIASAAALAARRINPALGDWLLLAHRSAEPGHARLLAALADGGEAPLLDLGLRLGEGSGAAVALPLLQAACALHADMATFDEAGVSRA
ncbi:nicotinate-nucleotide-dimethylbenzimidazole phosphoribosyltransferase [Plasticicumulans lactativorans]|uniref:Nicotinate-nucleotide--dimethylbenzimidazole phosphoribosyltransferase n=1 Tax=Plasticicumulans lactativorans TaxID=1133106 RepID=A0A4R2KUG3_9GAMM|nr:nicotinate-nucleotide--dimethylbenzimidazole phosphoribosyltransferase [Plasticicumulans lactativorans]TCO77524.1 nicotinate-nucleotide-dimethylbenzimidazole phosphoribosyltransferase [Plasticicumulans lactativorans]